jgi:mono/diheme cytochrome c family protein
MKRYALAILKTRPYVIYACAFLSSCKTSPAQEVRYSRQIAPIFALHCTGCHSDENPSSGFRTGSYRGLMQGGMIGDDIIPNNPDASILVKLIEGARGPEQRMPSGAHPLSASQIQLIRGWIEEGAKYDRLSVPCYSLQTDAVFPAHAKPLKISFRVPVAGTAELLLREEPAQKIIFRREASVKPAPEAMDAGAPDHWVTWAIGRERGWSAKVGIELRIRFAVQVPAGALLRIRDEDNPASVVKDLRASSCVAL